MKIESVMQLREKIWLGCSRDRSLRARFLVEVHGPKIDALPDHGLAKEKELALKILGKF